jgi:outer membrane protein assembly factor BamB
VAFQKQDYSKATKTYPRPDFAINKKYKNVKPTWTYSSSANVISTPVVAGSLVVFGNQSGMIEALDLKTGKRKWKYESKGPVFSSPAFDGKDKIVVGSADRNVYCLSTTGKLLWKYETGHSVLGSPIIERETVYFGGSDGNFTALDLKSGKKMWSQDTLGGPMVSKPVIQGDMIIFGAWDRYLYSLDKRSGYVNWKWSNGSSVINYSPASCIPVIHDDVVYVVAPDRYLSAIDISTGTTLWRTNQATVRESIGMAEDGSLVYGKTMQDTVVAFRTNAGKADLAWKMHVGYGYEHAPSMLVEKGGKVFFGTRNGVVYAIDPSNQSISWAYKIDNSMVNTVNVLGSRKLIASTMDGKVVLLDF